MVWSVAFECCQMLNFMIVAQYGALTTPMLLFQVFSMWYALDYFWHERSLFRMYDVIEERFGFMLIWGDYSFITFIFSINSWVYLHLPDTMTPLHVVLTSVVYVSGFLIFRLYVAQEAGAEVVLLSCRVLLGGVEWGLGRVR